MVPIPIDNTFIPRQKWATNIRNNFLNYFSLSIIYSPNKWAFQSYSRVCFYLIFSCLAPQILDIPLGQYNNYLQKPIPHFSPLPQSFPLFKHSQQSLLTSCLLLAPLLPRHGLNLMSIEAGGIGDIVKLCWGGVKWRGLGILRVTQDVRVWVISGLEGSNSWNCYPKLAWLDL